MDFNKNNKENKPKPGAFDRAQRKNLASALKKKRVSPSQNPISQPQIQPPQQNLRPSVPNKIPQSRVPGIPKPKPKPKPNPGGFVDFEEFRRQKDKPQVQTTDGLKASQERYTRPAAAATDGGGERYQNDRHQKIETNDDEKANVDKYQDHRLGGGVQKKVKSLRSPNQGKKYHDHRLGKGVNKFRPTTVDENNAKKYQDHRLGSGTSNSKPVTGGGEKYQDHRLGNAGKT